MAGEAIPDDIVNRPVLDVGLQFYLTAFYDLGTDRHFGVSAGPIPWTAKAQYAQYYGLDPLQTERFFSILDRLDFDYLQSIKKPGNSSGGPKRLGQ